MVLKKEIADQIKDLLQKNPQGLKITEIVRNIKINRNTAGRYLENLLISGQVEMRRLGMAKIYKISQRVPLSAVLSISSEFVIQLDSFLRIVFVNEPFCALVETDSKNLLGRNIEFTPIPLIFDELFVGFIERIKEAIAGHVWSGEIVFRAKGIIVFCRIAPTVFDDGRKGVSILIEDITSRRKAERQVEESERQFRLLAENSLDMIGRIRPDFTHSYASPAYETTLGYLPEEVLGNRWEGFLHPEDFPIMESVGNGLTRNNSSATIRVRAKHKDGHYLWLESSARAIFDEKTGELLEYYAVTRDITERKKAEDALRESEDRYRKLVEISPDAVLIHQDGIIIFVNPAALHLLGASNPDEIIGKNAFDFIQPEFRNPVSKNIEKDLGGDISPAIELIMTRLDGTLVIVEGRGVRTFIEGRPAVQVALRDITERKKAEDALRESEERLRSTFASMDDLVFNLDNNGIFVDPYNLVMAHLYVSPEHFMGKSFRDVLPEEVSDQIQKAITEVKNTGATHQIEYILPITDKPAWFNAKISPRYSLNRTFNGVTIVIRNITDSKLADMELRESEEKYRLVVENGYNAIYIYRDRQILFANHRVTDLTGYTSDELMEMNVWDLVHPDDRARMQESGKRRISGHSLPPNFTGRIIKKSGEVVVCEFFVNRILYQNQPALLGITRDITEQKKAENALRQNEEKFRAIVETSPNIIWEIDLQGKFLYLSPMVRTITGYTPEEMIGKSITDLVPEHGRSYAMKDLSMSISCEGASLPIEVSARHRNGSELILEIRPARMIGPDGNLIGFHGVAVDITDRKRSEEALRRENPR